MGEWVMWLAGAGLVAAVAAVGLWRAERKRAAALESDLDALQTRLNKLDSDQVREKKVRQKQAEELSELRKRADKAKRRTGKQAAQPLGTSSRISDLTTQLEQARGERERAIRERDALSTSLEGARREAQVASEKAEQASADAAKAGAAAQQAVVDEADPTQPLRADLAEARKRIAKLEADHEIARQTEARIRKRMQNQELLYASVRSELEVKKDRLRTQEEQIQRLQALKVAVLEDAPDDDTPSA